jgi:hypothetical protein
MHRPSASDVPRTNTDQLFESEKLKTGPVANSKFDSKSQTKKNFTDSGSLGSRLSGHNSNNQKDDS